MKVGARNMVGAWTAMDEATEAFVSLGLWRQTGNSTRSIFDTYLHTFLLFPMLSVFHSKLYFPVFSRSRTTSFIRENGKN